MKVILESHGGTRFNIYVLFYYKYKIVNGIFLDGYIK
jgi:hypothetical protein